MKAWGLFLLLTVVVLLTGCCQVMEGTHGGPC